MQLTQSTSMRQEMRTLLTPRMIQSMEILQLPLMALEERIEQELQSNPVLELREGETDVVEIANEDGKERDERSEEEHALVVHEDTNQAADFDRLEKISEYLDNEEFSAGSGVRPAVYDGERDKKLDAMANTASRGLTLTEHLMGQWAFIETTPGIRKAGEVLINYIDDNGYLRTPLEEIQKESKAPLTLEDLEAALKLVQALEPAGVGARHLKECLLLQLHALENEGEDVEEHDFELEEKLVSEHLKDLEMNRYPQISKKLSRSIDEIKAAVKQLSRLHPHPGKQIGGEDAPADHARCLHLFR